MTKIAKSLTDLIGNTPLLELTNYNALNSLEAKVIAKLEYSCRKCKRQNWLCHDQGWRGKRSYYRGYCDY